MATLPETPTETLLAARAGVRTAWSRVFQDWHGVVLGWCRLYGGPRIDAENAAQESFVRLHQVFSSFEPTSPFGAFLRNITRNVAREHRRRAWLRRWVPGLAVAPVDGAPGADRLLEQHQDDQRVAAALAALPELYREVIWLKDGEERTLREIAVLLDLPEQTVKTRLRRGRQKFREIYPQEALARVSLPKAAEGSR